MLILQRYTYFSAIVWPIHRVYLFTRQTKRILSLQRQGSPPLPYATGGPWHDGHLTCNYCDQTTRANRPVITAIIQIGRTPPPPLPLVTTPDYQRQSRASVLHQ